MGSDPMDQLVELAKQDLAARLNIDPAAINAKSAENVDWPDGSMGCARPGMFYTQVITPGYEIILTANGQDYRYTGARGSLALCEQSGRPKLPPLTP